jgi:EmrB/QacA subfamily drug resistance transporter
VRRLSQAAAMALESVPSQPVQTPDVNKWLIYALVANGVFMATLDSSIVNVTLPSIAHYFGMPLGAAVEWVVIAYLVTTAALLLGLGRLSDLVGRKPIWLSGLFVFTLGSALCGAAPSLWSLIWARVLQGAGGACLMSISPALLTSAFPREQRGRAIGLNSLVVALGISSGPTLGGLISAHFSWRYIFYLNLPLGIIGIVATWKFMPRDRARSTGHFHPLSALLLAATLAGLSAGMSLGNELGWSSLPSLGLIAFTLSSGGLFVVRERSLSDPLLPFALFRNRRLSAAVLALVLGFVGSFAISVLLPFYFQQLRGFDAAQAGLLLTPLPLTLALIAPLSGTLSDRFGSRALATLGMSIMCAGVLSLSTLRADSTKLAIVLRLMLMGCGQAMFQSPNNSALLGAAAKQDQGIAAGVLATGRVMGQSLSVALAGAVFAATGGAAAGHALAAAAAGTATESLRGTFLASLHTTMYVLAVAAACSAISSLVRGGEPGAR